ncbi:hypothetical protein [Chryseobacterium sp. EO14]|uniref:hypothetical protein n=1 Tax=Chryseobacterium sp. EO14 TaxID=2950551 RepID=UPI00210931C4|nr:hypothetical protein [Chryseobacterium sp. EO14]MCQ4139238.1 hypothetical protein [Chryseobacterium sp. EO14]
MSNILFEKLGIDPASIEGLTEEKAVELVGNIENGIKTKLLENEDFYKTLDESKLPADFKNKYLSEGTAKIAGMAKKSLDKEFGLTEEDKKQFGEDDLKNIDKYILKVKDIYSQKVSSGNKDVDSLQNENLTLKQLTEELKGKYENLSSEFETKTSERLKQKEVETLTMLEAFKLNANLVGNIGATFKLVYPTLTNKYAIVEEGGIPSIRKKDNPSFKVEFDNDGKKEHLTLEKALEIEYKALGLWKEAQQGNSGDGKTVTVTTDFNSKTIPDNIKDIIDKENAFMQG